MYDAEKFLTAVIKIKRMNNTSLNTTILGQLIYDLTQKGIHVRGASKSGLTEEKPDAYKDVNAVVDVVHHAGISLKVAKMVPIGVIKG